MNVSANINLKEIRKAYSVLKDVVVHTPLVQNINTSGKHECLVYLKREDLQVVRSYKIRGAYNKLKSLTQEELKNGIVCASAGNHAQGVAYSCSKLKVKGTIFMPTTTPKQKINQVKMFGEEWVEVKLIGDTYDDSYQAALTCQKEHNLAFIHPFDDEKVIEGQATVGIEILEDADFEIDYLIVPVGGGGLASGVSSVFKELSPKTKIIGVEPLGAAALNASLKNGYNTTLNDIDKFVDGAAVQRVGDLTYDICKNLLDDVISVHEGKVCSTILELYNKDAIVVEPAGALTLAALDQLKDKIKNKNVVCVVSGSNNDISRMQEIKERSLLYEQLKHYFIVNFPQRAGALREFLLNVLGPTDDIVHFEFSKKTNKENGPAVVGIELKNKKDFAPLIKKMKEFNFYGEYLNDKPHLFEYLV
ncbi:MAG: threonine ammonia-lyase IlvA [Cyclobacteriaceae bacterium]|nr:threonine ammonia-lyase IlvA [Cyclobacteriaceae bacterium]